MIVLHCICHLVLLVFTNYILRKKISGPDAVITVTNKCFCFCILTYRAKMEYSPPPSKGPVSIPPH